MTMPRRSRVEEQRLAFTGGQDQQRGRAARRHPARAQATGLPLPARGLPASCRGDTCRRASSTSRGVPSHRARGARGGHARRCRGDLGCSAICSRWATRIASSGEIVRRLRAGATSSIALWSSSPPTTGSAFAPDGRAASVERGNRERHRGGAAVHQVPASSAAGASITSMVRIVRRPADDRAGARQPPELEASTGTPDPPWRPADGATSRCSMGLLMHVQSRSPFTEFVRAAIGRPPSAW